MSNVCKQLADKRWENEKNRPMNKRPGIYAIGKRWKKEGRQYEKTIYVGRSKNIRVRINQHSQPLGLNSKGSTNFYKILEIGPNLPLL